MFEIIYMKADFEPWWMFEGWEKTIVTRQSFLIEEEARNYLNMKITEFRATHSNERIKNECFFAFWSDDEKHFCEACDEDSQIYHGLILLYENKPFILGNA